MSRHGGIAANREVYQQIFAHPPAGGRAEDKIPLPERGERSQSAVGEDVVYLSGGANPPPSFEGISAPVWESGQPFTGSDPAGELDELFRALEREGRLRAQDLQGEES